MDAHAPRDPIVGADYVAFGRTRVVDHAVARDHLSSPSWTGFELPCATQSVFIAASLWRRTGRNGLLHPLAQRVRGFSATCPGIAPRREVRWPGGPSLPGRYRLFLYLYVLRKRDWLGHGRHGCLCRSPEPLLRSRPEALGNGVVVRGAGDYQQRDRGGCGHHQFSVG